MPSVSRTFTRLSLAVLERGWLSSNNVLFTGGGGATLVDTGYSSHSEQTAALVAARLGTERLARVVNTHLHSDHCGGNAALYSRWQCRIAVPEGVFASAEAWNDAELTFHSTGQRCDRFPVHEALSPGMALRLGTGDWQVHGAPGHDPGAIMLFQPEERVLISGDALWQHGVAILFPEFSGGEGFEGAHHALETIERLAPRIVIPGHGAPFTGVHEALLQSRSRLQTYERRPDKHRDYSGRALLMFHMLEHRGSGRAQLVAWASSTPVFQRIFPLPGIEQWIEQLVDRLASSGALRQEGEHLEVDDH